MCQNAKNIVINIFRGQLRHKKHSVYILLSFVKLFQGLLIASHYIESKEYFQPYNTKRIYVLLRGEVARSAICFWRRKWKCLTRSIFEVGVTLAHFLRTSILCWNFLAVSLPKINEFYEQILYDHDIIRREINVNHFLLV